MVSGRMEYVGPEERHRIYKLLKLRVEAQRDGNVEIKGVRHFYTASRRMSIAELRAIVTGRIGRWAITADTL